jgi:hypothetical protein
VTKPRALERARENRPGDRNLQGDRICIPSDGKLDNDDGRDVNENLGVVREVERQCPVYGREEGQRNLKEQEREEEEEERRRTEKTTRRRRLEDSNAVVVLVVPIVT